MPTHCGSTVPFVNFLDTSIGFGDRWSRLGRLDVLPYRKPSSRWRPLSHTSMHAPQIHCSWPIQHMRRFQCLSTSTSALRQFLSAYVLEFTRLCSSHPSLPAMQHLADTAFPVSHRQRRAKGARNELESWLVIPFFPGFFALRLARVVQDVQLQFVDSGIEVPKVRISWKLGSTHTGQVVRKL